MPKIKIIGGKIMLATLILLYALDTGQIPAGCYVAAWVFTGIELLLKLIDLVAKQTNK